MKKIFCLETEWTQSIHDMKDSSLVQPLLEYVKRVNGTQLAFRSVATKSEFDYYIRHLLKDSYRAFNTVYLCFHGERNVIHFANGEQISLDEFGESYPGIFLGKTVHFGSCSTLRISEREAVLFKEKTGAKLLSGYSKKVNFTPSFIFELWLMNVLTTSKSIGSQNLSAKIDREMKYFKESLGFKIY